MKHLGLSFALALLVTGLAAQPVNDCITNAIDITALFTTPPLNSTHAFNCNQSAGGFYTYASGTAPTVQNVIGDPNSCNGWSTAPPYPAGTATAAHRDVWYKYTVSAGGLNAFLQMFPSGGSGILAMGLYRETTPGVAPTVAGGGCAFSPTGNISGLTFQDCSVGELLDAATTAPTYGGLRDKARCSTPIHPRLDVSQTVAGTYYIRVWIYGGGSSTNRSFNLCAERTPVDYPPSISDACPTGPNVGYMGSDFNADITITYLDQSNAGGSGNAYGGSGSISAVCGGYASNEPRLGTPTSTDVQFGCTGPYGNSSSGSINNIMNVSVVHAFTINACPGSEPTVSIQFANISTGGTPGNVPQIQVMAPGNCSGSFATQMYYAGPQTCFRMRPLGNSTLSNGTYYIVIDGQDGQLIEYDLTLTIDYPQAQTASCTPILPVELLYFEAKSEHSSVRTTWATASEVNSDQFSVLRSRDGTEFQEIGTVEGALNSSNMRAYVLYDSNPLPGLAYYRLKQTDLDGNHTLSEIVAVTREALDDGTIFVHPNPATSVMNFATPGFEDGYDLTILEVSGKELRTIRNLNGLNFRLDVSGMENGLYYFTVSSGARVSMGRFFVQHER